MTSLNGVPAEQGAVDDRHESGTKSLRARLARGAASAFLINSVGVGLAFLAQLTAARLLGLESYGIFSLVHAWILVLWTASTLGFELSVLRFAAPYHQAGDLGRLRGVIRFAELTSFGAGVTLAGLGALLVLALDTRLSAELRLTFWIALAAVPLLALLRVRFATLRAVGQVAKALIPDKVARESVFILTLLLAILLLQVPAQAPVAALCVVLGAGSGLALASYWNYRAVTAELSAVTSDLSERPLWWRTTWPLWLVQLGQLAMSRIDVLLLGWLVSPTAAGIFVACFVAAQVVVFPLVAVNFLLSPNIAALHAKGDLVRLQSTITTTSWWTTLGALLFAGPLLVIAPDILQLFGRGFEAHADVLRILLLGQLVNAAAGSILPLLSLTGEERNALSISASALAIKLVLALAVIPIFGVVGAAVVEALSRAGWNIVMGITVWRRLGILPSILYSFKFLRQRPASD